jgi:site-specific DNA-methyltransferase (adenine-specific)
VAAQVLKTGTGAINIDGTRIAVGDPEAYQENCSGDRGHEDNRHRASEFAMSAGKASKVGRWPANLVLSHSTECKRLGDQDGVAIYHCVGFCPVRALDEQTGEGDSGVSRFYHNFEPDVRSPFFYTGKASKSDKNADLEEYGLKNTHPTPKAQSLMCHLVRLVTPKGGIVLDPFAGSGSTLVAAVTEGMQFIGIEREPEYHQIAKARTDAALGRAEVKAREAEMFNLMDELPQE